MLGVVLKFRVAVGLKALARGLGRVTALSALLASLAPAPPARALSIEITGGGADRLDRQRAWAEDALPLTGTPDLGKLSERLSAAGLKEGAAVFVRLFKSESELELWMQKGRDFVLFATYPICQWSGVLGPKFYEGDNQSPEGFYSVGRRDLKWQTRHHRAFNIGFPNAFDKLHGRTGSNILVHGGCSTEGCFAMTNPVIDEVFRLANSAIASGQKDIQVHVFPFRMTPANLLQNSASPWIDFWINLKTGYDLFAETRQPPAIGICKNRYSYDRVPEFGAVALERDCDGAGSTDVSRASPPTGASTGPISAPSINPGTVPGTKPGTGPTTGNIVTTGSVRATSAVPPAGLKGPSLKAGDDRRALPRRAVRARQREGRPAPSGGGEPAQTQPPLPAVPAQQMGT